MKQRTAVLFVLGMLPWAGLHAQKSATAVLRVSATVVESCDVSVPDLALGEPPVRGGAPLRAAMLLRATCSPDATYLVGLNKVLAPGAMLNQRKMMATVTGVGTGSAVNHTLFGGIPAIQGIPPVDDIDTMMMRVYY